jgi:hypothetical protein
MYLQSKISEVNSQIRRIFPQDVNFDLDCFADSTADSDVQISLADRDFGVYEAGVQRPL